MAFTHAEKKEYAIKKAKEKLNKDIDMLTNEVKNSGIIVDMAIKDVVAAIMARDIAYDKMTKLIRKTELDKHKYEGKKIDHTADWWKNKRSYEEKIVKSFNITDKSNGHLFKGKVGIHIVRDAKANEK